MNIHDTLHRMIVTFKSSHPQDPKFVYIGHEEWHQLMADNRRFMRMDESGKESFMGIEIVRVDKVNHLNVA